MNKPKWTGQIWNDKHLTDILNGKQNEIDVKNILEKYFSITLAKLPKNHTFDFIDLKGQLYEVKSRNNKYNKYPTTMVGYNKLQYAMNINKKCYFVIKFTDGIYYYEFDKNKINEIDIKIGGRQDRGYNEFDKYAYISIDLLKKIEFNNKPPSEKSIEIYEEVHEEIICESAPYL